jgi:hypothetical protein
MTEKIGARAEKYDILGNNRKYDRKWVLKASESFTERRYTRSRFKIVAISASTGHYLL